MQHDPSKLFGKAGYIPIREYVADIFSMEKDGPWKLPLRFIDRLHIMTLALFGKFSWYADAISIAYSSNISPAYSILLTYVQKKDFADTVSEKRLSSGRYVSYYLEKQVWIEGKKWRMSGQGVAENRATAFSIALGEMLERVITGLYDRNKNIVFAPPYELMKKYSVVYPPKYHRFLPIQKKQFKELRHDPKESIAWVWGRNMITGEKTYIPKGMSSWFTENRQKNSLLINATTNGSAGYFTKEGAILRGLLEVVQRDAFLVHWLTSIPPQVIQKNTLPVEIQEKIEEFEKQGMTLFIMNVTAIPIPSVFIAAVSESSDNPQVVLSGATSLNFNEAIQSALKEMVISAEMFSYPNDDIENKKAAAEHEPFTSNLGKLTRQLYWRGSERVAQFRWFTLGQPVTYADVIKADIPSVPNDAQRLKKCLTILHHLGQDYFPVVYFPKNKIQGELGFYIAQVYIPKAFPLYLVERYGTFESDRLQEFARSRGVIKWKLNPLPHMFS